MNPGIHSSSSRRTRIVRNAHMLASLAMGLAMGVAWLPAVSADAPPPPPPPYTIVVDRLESPVDSGDGVSFHTGQYVRYRVRAYDQSGNLTKCDPANSNVPQVLKENPKTGAVIDEVWGGYVGGESVVNVIMGQAHGAASFAVSCNAKLKRVLLSNDGEPLPPTQQAQNATLIQEAKNATPLMSSPSLAGTPADETAPEPTPPPEEAASGGHALLIAGIVAAGVVGAVAIAAAASAANTNTTTGGGGGGCSITFAQCCPSGSNSGQVCAPDRGGCANSASSCPSGTSAFTCNGDPNGCGAFFSSGEVGCTC